MHDTSAAREAQQQLHYSQVCMLKTVFVCKIRRCCASGPLRQARHPLACAARFGGFWLCGWP